MKIHHEPDVKLIDSMGSDLSVVNAARVSFAKIKTNIDEKDEKLISYLAKNKHFTPFCHAFASFRIEAPIFVARQLVKHQVGLSWNETSRRYVDNLPEFYLPKTWRKRAKNAKQGSLDSAVGLSKELEKNIVALLEAGAQLYSNLLSQGVCPEQVRMVLPQNMMTEWIWSGSLMAFSRVCSLRLDAHAQKETAEVAKKIDVSMRASFPLSWEALQSLHA